MKILSKLNGGKTLTDEEIEAMSWSEKTRLVQKDPITCARYFDNRVQDFIRTVLKSDHMPLGRLKDYFYRVEFQHRGSPHIHMLMWIENAPQFKKNDNQTIAAFIDKYVSCSLDVESDDMQWVSLQKHKHSKTCMKKK